MPLRPAETRAPTMAKTTSAQHDKIYSESAELLWKFRQLAIIIVGVLTEDLPPLVNASAIVLQVRATSAESLPEEPKPLARDALVASRATQ